MCQGDNDRQRWKEREAEVNRSRLFFICGIDELIMLPGLITASFQRLFVLAGWKSMAGTLIFCYLCFLSLSPLSLFLSSMSSSLPSDCYRSVNLIMRRFCRAG